jgi:hypothetical protein
MLRHGTLSLARVNHGLGALHGGLMQVDPPGREAKCAQGGTRSARVGVETLGEALGVVGLELELCRRHLELSVLNPNSVGGTRSAQLLNILPERGTPSGLLGVEIPSEALGVVGSELELCRRHLESSARS